MLGLLLLAACGGGKRYHALMHEADSLLTAGDAVTAYRLLAEADSQKTAWSRREEMDYELLKAQAQNRAYVDFQTDSVLRVVARYYDRHGTPNQRLKAHYLLGCTYRDLHEAPKALECFHDAIECADTLSVDCDFNVLSCVYSQMAELYHYQFLLTHEISSHYLSSKYALQAGDTLNAIYEYAQNASAYILANRSDSAEQILLHAKELYLQHGWKKRWAWTSPPLMFIYLRQAGKLDKVKELMDFYERESGLFDENGMLPASKRMFFRYKGQYYEQNGQLDSAEFFYRKMLHSDMSYSQEDAMYHGLLNVFVQQNDVDSIVKYALLYCQSNDSSVVKKDRQLMAQMTGSYNYSRIRQQAIELKAKTANARFLMTVFIALSFFLVLFSVGFWLRNRRKRLRKQMELNRLREELADAESKYQAEIQALRILEANHQNMMELAQLKLQSSDGDVQVYRTKFEEAQQELNQLTAIHEESLSRHQSELNSLRMRIAELKHFSTLTKDLEQGQSFKSTEVARKILKAVGKSKFDLQEEDWNSLTLEFSQHYPTLLSDLHKLYTSREEVIRVCILLILGLRESDIANILHVGKSAVSNIKSDINNTFFNEKSSRSLFKNLEQKYGLFS